MYEEFIEVNNKLLWSIVSNKDRQYFSNTFHKFMLKYYDKDDLYQELLMKLLSVYDTFNGELGKQTTYFTTVCINHLITLMQPYKSKKYKSIVLKDYDISNITDNIDYELLYENKITIQYIKEWIKGTKYEDIVLLILQGLTQSEIAIELQLSRQRVSQVYLEFIERIKVKLC